MKSLVRTTPSSPWPWLALLLALLLAACGGQPDAPAGLFPGAEALPAWTPTGDVQVYDHDNLYDLVDGQADAFFAYGFEGVVLQSYEHGSGEELRAAIWQLAAPADAYGLFTTTTLGQPLSIGNGGFGEPGRRLGFWQDRYYVDLFALAPLPDDDLQDLGRAVSANLPAGGEPPILVDRLPPDGLLSQNPIFFHEEISIQDYLWLGGTNILALNSGTGGLLAPYDLGGGPVQLLLVQYPTAGAASAGLDALLGAEFEQLAAAEVHADLLGAVFGQVDAATAGALLALALADR